MTQRSLLTHRLDPPTGPPHATAPGDSRPPVLLLNGGMMTFASWQPIVDRLLAAGFSVLRCDLRGQLLSPGRPPASLDGHAEDVVALLEHLGVGPVHAVGVSFGGLVATRLALRPSSTAQLRSLMVVTAAARATPAMDDATRAFRKLLDAVLTADDAAAERRARLAVQDRLADEVFSAGWRREQAALLAARRERVDDLPRSWYEDLQGLLAVLEGYDLAARPPRSAEAPLPCRVLLAGDDAVMPAAGARALASALGASVAVRPGAGHAVVLEDAAWVADEMLDFLDAANAASAARGPR